MTRVSEQITLTSPGPGTRRSLKVHRYGSAGARPKAYLHAALHADEWPGLLTLNHLIGMLDEADADGRIAGEVVLLPFANPIGMAQRFNGYFAGRHAFDGSGRAGRLIEIVDRNGNRLTLIRDDAGRLTEVLDTL